MTEFKDYYKKNHTLNQLKEQQITRRVTFLEEQKRRRQEQIEYQRDLKEILFKKPKANKEVKSKRINYEYRNILMLSEWMMELPEDLDDFLLIPCPTGIRVVVVASNNQKTETFYKNGMHFFNFKSNLPHDTILDCIFNKSNNTIYVLDVLVFAGKFLFMTFISNSV